MTELQRERAKRGLPWYRDLPRRYPRRREGQPGHLSAADRDRLRTLIARMIADDPGVVDVDIVSAFAQAAGVKVTDGTIRYHRRQMGLKGRRYRQQRARR